MSVRAVPALRSTSTHLQHTGRERRSATQAPQAGNIPHNDQSQRLRRGIFRAPTNRAGFAHRSAQPLVKCQAKGFGGDDAGDEGRDFAKERRKQRQATEVLAELLKAKDKEATAAAMVEDLSEEFFMMTSAYLEIAKKEKNTDVVAQMETALQAALKMKEKTLRPEIQLLNQLLRAKTKAERQSVLAQDPPTLVLNDGYFFKLLERMAKDVGRQPENPKQQELVAQLQAIKFDATKEESKLKQ